MVKKICFLKKKKKKQSQLSFSTVCVYLWAGLQWVDTRVYTRKVHRAGYFVWKTRSGDLYIRSVFFKQTIMFLLNLIDFFSIAISGYKTCFFSHYIQLIATCFFINKELSKLHSKYKKEVFIQESFNKFLAKNLVYEFVIEQCILRDIQFFQQLTTSCFLSIFECIVSKIPTIRGLVSRYMGPQCICKIQFFLKLWLFLLYLYIHNFHSY